MPDKPEPKNVYEAVNYVMQQVSYVQKERGRDLPYTFASEAAFINTVRPHMVKVGLFVYPSSMRDIPAESFTSKKGSVINITKLAMTYCFHHAPSGTAFCVNVIGKGMDSGDKDSNKAMTAAFKYALRQTLMIETGDDPDKTPNGEFERTEAEQGQSIARIENQWEQEIIDKLLDLQLVQTKPHAVNILNRSPFMSVPYRQLNVVDAVAYVIGWSGLDDKKSSDEKQAVMNKAWADGDNDSLLAKAIEMLGGE